jgi:surface antigen
MSPRPIRIMTVLLGLALGACAGLTGGDSTLYEQLNEQDVALAARVVQTTLEQVPDGVTRSWSNQTTGHSGQVTPVRTYVSIDGRFCREYREDVVVGAAHGRFYHTACRGDGEARWVWL